jgi:hypothetical protein
MAPVRALPVKQGLAHQAKSLPCDLLMARPCRRANQADSDGIRTDVEAQGGMEGVCSWVRAEAPWGHLHGRSTPRGRALFRGRGRTDQAERRQGTVGYRETSLHGATEDQRPFDEVLAPIRTRKAEGEGTEQQVCHRRERFVLGQGKRLGTHGEKRSREGNGRPKGGGASEGKDYRIIRRRCSVRKRAPKDQAACRGATKSPTATRNSAVREWGICPVARRHAGGDFPWQRLSSRSRRRPRTSRIASPECGSV